MEKAEVKEIAETAAQAITHDLKADLVERLNGNFQTIREELHSQREDQVRQSAETSAKLNTTTQALTSCVTKIEQLHIRIFTGNGQPSVVSEIADMKSSSAAKTARLVELEAKVADLEKFRTWFYTGLIMAAGAGLISLIGWAVAKVASL